MEPSVLLSEYTKYNIIIEQIMKTIVFKIKLSRDSKGSSISVNFFKRVHRVGEHGAS